jgi:hypothetical protein
VAAAVSLPCPLPVLLFRPAAPPARAPEPVFRRRTGGGRCAGKERRRHCVPSARRHGRIEAGKGHQRPCGVTEHVEGEAVEDGVGCASSFALGAYRRGDGLRQACSETLKGPFATPQRRIAQRRLQELQFVAAATAPFARAGPCDPRRRSAQAWQAQMESGSHGDTDWSSQSRLGGEAVPCGRRTAPWGCCQCGGVAPARVAPADEARAGDLWH